MAARNVPVQDEVEGVSLTGRVEIAEGGFDPELGTDIVAVAAIEDSALEQNDRLTQSVSGYRRPELLAFARTHERKQRRVAVRLQFEAGYHARPPACADSR